MLGFAGFDWVLIDCEHGSIGPADVELMAMACDAVGITPIARPRTQCRERHPERHGPRRDGRAGAARQHRRGRPRAPWPPSSSAPAPRAAWRPARGPTAGGSARACPTSPRAANAQSLVCVQLEHDAALRNIDAILAVEGIDVFFIGPSDLSQSMGFPGNPKAPPVAKAIDEALAAIVAAGRTPGMPATAGHAGRCRGQGLPLYLHAPAAPCRHGGGGRF